MKPTIEDAPVEKIHWTLHEVMMELDAHHETVKRMMEKLKMRPKVNSNGFKRFSQEQVEALRKIKSNGLT